MCILYFYVYDSVMKQTSSTWSVRVFFATEKSVFSGSPNNSWAGNEEQRALLFCHIDFFGETGRSVVRTLDPTLEHHLFPWFPDSTYALLLCTAALPGQNSHSAHCGTARDQWTPHERLQLHLTSLLFNN